MKWQTWAASSTLSRRAQRVRSVPSRLRRRAESLRGWEECEPRTLLTTVLVSTNAAGSDSGNSASAGPALDASGRTIAFDSLATDLVTGLADTNDDLDVFVRDMVTGATQLVSVNAAGTGAGDAPSQFPVVTPDGRFIAFESLASDLVAGDTNGARDVFVRDLQAGTTVLASVNAAGTASGDGPSSGARLSADGRYVVFQSRATDLVAGVTDTNGAPDVFVRDLLTGVTRLVSHNTAGTGTGDGQSFEPVISADGQFVAFDSDASDLDPGISDANGLTDVFLYDMSADTTTMVSRSASGAASANSASHAFGQLVNNLSPDGRFFVYTSSATDLVTGLADDNSNTDIFVYDRLTGTNTLVSVNAAGTAAGNGGSRQASFRNGVVAFQSDATDLVAGLIDANGETPDVFARDVASGTTVAVSVNALGTATSTGFASAPVLTDDGRTVVFSTTATDIDPRDTDPAPDIYAHDLATGATRLISVNATGTAGSGDGFLPYVNADGTVIAFESLSSILVPGDRHPGEDVFAVTDRPTVQVDSADYGVTEGDPSVTVTLRRTGDLSAPLTVAVQTVDGNATAGADYVALNQTVNFLAGQDTATVVVQLLDDAVYEGDETFTVRLSDATDPTFIGSPQGGLVTITDDEPGPTVSVDDASAVEGDDFDFNEITFHVTLSFAAPQAITVSYATQDGTAVDQEDYIGDVFHVTFAAGETEKDITIFTIGDTVGEPDETFQLILSNPNNGATLDRAVGTGTITNDDPLPVMSVGDASTAEGNSGTTVLTFHVMLSFALTVPVTVSYATQDGTAAAPGDYTPASGTLTFDPGVTDMTVNVEVAGDTLFEPVESFQLVLSSPSAATLGQGSATGTITNDDSPPVVSVGDVSAAEGDSGTTALTFHVTLSGPAGVPVTVSYATQDGTATAAGDYAAASGTLTFDPGVTDLTVTVDVAGDTLFESDEDLQLVLTNPSVATFGQASATGTITNDDPAPSVSVADVSAAEGNSGTNAMTFHVTLSAPSALPVTVAYTTQDGTAAAPGDFAATSGTLTFAPGVTDLTVTVNVAGDTLFESGETFQLVLSNPSGATLGQAVGTATVTNDDAPPSLSIADASVPEGDSGTTALVFHVTLSAPSGLPVTVSYAAQGPPVSGTLTFAPGVTDQTITVDVTGDTLFEPNENFAIQLFNPSGATLFDPVAFGNILNDDPAPSISVSDVSVAEGNGGTTTLTFHVTLSGPSGIPASVGYATQDGTATAPGDYAPASGTLTFAPGVTDLTVTVNVAGDTLFEADETLALVLSNPSNATLGRAAATGTILNDDAAPSLSVADVSAAEGNSGTTSLTFRVVLSAPSALPVTVAFATQDGTATAPGDYASASGTLTFNPGVTEQTVTINVAGDASVEPDETFRLALSNPSGAGISRGVATGTITNDDSGGAFRFSASQYSGAEGSGPVLVKVERTGGTAGGVAVRLGSSGGSATEGVDYDTSSFALLTFGPGETSKTLAISITDDALLEGPETAILTLTDPAGGSSPGTPVTATLAIADNDDTDGDGISNADEATGPNGGDANGDGIPDSQQPNVASFQEASGGNFVTLVGPAGTSFSGTRAVPMLPPDAPPGLTFPVGLFGFTLRLAQPGGAADVTVLLPPGVAVDSYAKFGATAGDPSAHWYVFDSDGTTGATIRPGRVVLHLVDGLRGDSDLIANGLITDPGAPALSSRANLAVTATPTAVTATPGRPLTFRLTVTNHGPAQATNVVLTSNLPAGVTPGKVVASRGTAAVAGRVVTARLGNLAAGATATVTVTVTPGSAGVRTVSARVRSDQVDPSPGNNTAQLRLNVVASGSTGPQVARLQRFGVGNQPTRLVLTFNRALNPSTAIARRNYRVIAPGRDGRLGTRDDRAVAIRSLSYDPARHTVTIVTAQPLSLNRVYRLVVNGTTLGAVTDLAGRRLDGDRNGRAGGDALLRVSRAELVIPARAPVNGGPLAMVKAFKKRP